MKGFETLPEPSVRVGISDLKRAMARYEGF